jgi:hypothetical protein
MITVSPESWTSTRVSIAILFSFTLAVATQGSFAQTIASAGKPTNPIVLERGNSSSAVSSSNAGGQAQRRLQGCLKSDNGKYVLQGKSGKKRTTLRGSRDLASHVGHTVMVRGSFAPESSVSPATGAQFLVSSLESVSESCNPDRSPTAYDENGKPSPYRK